MSAVEHENVPPRAPTEREALVVEAARAAIAQEFQIAERLDAKARNQIAVGGAWYALVQAAGSIAIRQYLDRGGSDTLAFSAVLVLAGVSGFALAVSIAYCYGVWKLRDEKEMTPDAIEAMAESARDPDADLLSMFVQHYRFILWHRRANNALRARNFKRSTPWWVASLLFGLAELIAAVAVLAQS